MRPYGIWTALAVAFTAASGVGLADDDVKQGVKVEVSERGVKIHVGNENNVPHVFRTDNFLGMAVRNKEGKELGTVNDLVVDFECGSVRYAAISFGGFLGFGDKLFAVPLSAMELRYDGDDDKSFLVFDVDKERLNESPGFDKNNWPDFAAAGWSQEIDKFYGVEFNDTTVGVEVKGEPEDRKRNLKAGGHKGHHVMRASQIDGMEVQNTGRESLGNVSDLIINARSGMISHLVVQTGAVAGVGGEFVIVPIKPFKMTDRIADNKRLLTVPFSQETMNQAPRVGDQWPAFHEKGWSKRFDDFFDKHTDGEA